MNGTVLRLLLVVACLAVLALAAVPCYGQNNVIYACITKSTGQIRIVSAASQCKSNEASISWNIAGQPGPAGPAGPSGPAGPQGPAAGVCSDSSTKTYLLFPFVSNQSGFDTGLAIANTGLDPSGTSGQAGTVVLNFYGSNAPAAVTTATIDPGTLYTNLTSTLAPGFQGYVIATSNFPLAHGWSFFSDLGARNLGTSNYAVTICIPRIPPR